MSKVLKPLVILLFSFALTLCVHAEEAIPLDYKITAYFPGSSAEFNLENISDGNINTTATLPSGCGIELSTGVDSTRDGESIGYVYVKFTTTPVPYSVTYNSTVGTVAYNTGNDDMKVLPAGDYGFLHELTVIDGEASSVMISSKQDMEIADIILYSKGELPADVQRWEPTLSECDMLCFPTHADDESLFMGALIAESAARGRLVQVALICNDKKEPVRPHELLDAVWTLGVRTYPIIGSFPILYSKTLRYASTQYDSNEMRGFIVECIRRTKPSVIVAHDIDGEYGHGAHMLTSLLVREAIKLTGNPESYTDSAEKFGLHNVKKLFLHLYGQNEIILDVDKAYATLRESTPFDIAVAAYDKYQSQHVFEDFAVVKYGTIDCRRFGLYYSDVGYDVSSGDVFEGIDPVIPSAAETIDTSESSALTPQSSDTTPTHLPNSDGVSESVRNAFAHTGVGFCILLAALILLYGIITARRR